MLQETSAADVARQLTVVDSVNTNTGVDTS